MIIVNITTWIKRDSALYEMLSHFTKQTMKPDKIVLWLSEEEYDKNNLPISIQKCKDAGLLTDIKFVNQNTYSHKRWNALKEFPDDYNIFCDDDIYYKQDYVKELYTAAVKFPDCAIVYAGAEGTFDNTYRSDKKAKYNEPTKANQLLSGMTCIPPRLLPTCIFSEQYIYYRDKYCTKCDDSWINGWLIKLGIHIVTLHDRYDNAWTTIANTQACGIWEENRKKIDGIEQKTRNFANAIKIIDAEKECLAIWPKFNINKAAMIKYNYGISICISAYNAVDYIKETLDSVYKQSWFKNHNNYEVLIGIDHCEKTLSYVRTIMNMYPNLTVIYMDKNVGTYVTTNTLMSNAKYQYLIRFDSDDIMHDNMVEVLMSKYYDYDFVNYQLMNFGEQSYQHFAEGSIFIKHDIFDKFGGYRNWVCGADSEFRERVNRFVKYIRINDILYGRRLHSASLYNKKETTVGSDIRNKYVEFIENVTKKINDENDAIIECCTMEYSMVDPLVLDYQYTLITIIRNENKYIREWVDYYKKLGITHIILLDNNFIDGENPIDILKNDINEGFVEIIDHRQDRNNQECHLDIQKQEYYDLYNKYKDSCNWFFFFDADEFLYLVGYDNVQDFLSQDKFNNIDRILVNWKNYDDNDLIHYDSRPVQERFTREAPDIQWLRSNNQVKSILRGGKELICTPKNLNIHKILVRNNIVANADGIILDHPNANVGCGITDKTYSSAYLKHYVTKTIEEYIERYSERYNTLKLGTFGTKEYYNINEIKYNFFNINKRTDEKLKLLSDNYIAPSIESVNEIVVCTITDSKLYKPIRIDSLSNNCDYVCITNDYNIDTGEFTKLVMHDSIDKITANLSSVFPKHEIIIYIKDGSCTAVTNNIIRLINDVKITRYKEYNDKDNTIKIINKKGTIDKPGRIYFNKLIDAGVLY